MKTINPNNPSHPRIWFILLILAISICAGFIAFKFNLLIAQEILTKLLQSTPTLFEDPALVFLFPFKISATAMMALFAPLFLAWYFRENFANYIFSTGIFCLAAATISIGTLAVYREYMKTELKLTANSAFPVSMSNFTLKTRGQFTAVTEVPIAKMILSGPLSVTAIGAVFLIRKNKPSNRQSRNSQKDI